MNNNELWQSVLAQVQLNVSRANFATWFKNAEIISQKKEKVIVSVPNSFVKEWLENKYNKTIFKIIHELNNEIKKVEYIIGKPKLKIFKKNIVNLPKTDQLEFQQFKVDKNSNLNPRYTFDSFVIGSFNELPHAAAIAVVKNPGFVYNPLFIYGGTGLGKTHILQAVGNEIIKSFKKRKYNICRLRDLLLKWFLRLEIAKWNRLK